MEWAKNVFYSSFLFDFFVKTFGGMKISGNFALFLKHKLLFYYLILNEMKKLFLSFAVLAGLSMISCGNKAENAEAADAVDSVEVVEEVAVDTVAVGDTVATDTVVAVEATAE